MTPGRRLRAGGAAVASGLTLWLSHPPAGWWVLSFATVPLLLLALTLQRSVASPGGPRASTARGALVVGLVVGAAAYGPMLWWIATPAGMLGWILLVLVQAAWVAAAALAMAPVVHRGWIVLVAPVAWLAMDAWRAQIPLNGFGWGSIAYAHVGDAWLRPLARVTGGHGITLAVVLSGVLAFEAGRRLWRGASDLEAGDGVAPAVMREARPPLLGLAALLLVLTLITVGPPPGTGRRLDVLSVQGNDIVEWGRGGGEGGGEGGPAEEAAEALVITERMLEQTRLAVEAGGAPELTVWPESSIDRDPETPAGRELQPLIDAAAGLVEGRLMVGVKRQGPRPATFLNTAALLDDQGRQVDRYVKRRLVPFGEYVPARPVLGDLPPLRQVPRDGIAADQAHNLDVDGVRIAPVICFETLFPGLVRTNVLAAEEPAELVVASTNDASFGRSAEPAQHLDQSRLRAIETGRWVVHAALSGSSAFVDPEGDLHQPTELFTRTWIRRSVPLVREPTPFLVVGDLVGTLGRMGGVGLVAWGLLRWWRGRRAASARPEVPAGSTPSGSSVPADPGTGGDEAS